MTVQKTVGNAPRESLWDKPQAADGDVRDMEGKTFLLTGAKLRTVQTREYGEKTALDLVVLIDGESFTYSGFSAGIIQQIRSAQDADFPTWATVEVVLLSGGRSTLSLVPCKEGEGTLLEAPQREAQGSLPGADAADDDIPF